MNKINQWTTPKKRVQATAHVINPERRALWLSVLGGDEVPIRSPYPETGHFNGLGKQLYYRLDLDAITPDQRARLVASLADRFEMSLEEVEEAIEGVGVPVLAADVVVVMQGESQTSF